MDDSSRINALQLKVGELERKLEYVMQHLNLQYHENPLSAAETQAAEMLRAGNKMEAIKAYRQVTNLGLNEAKTAVEALERRLSGR